MKFSDAILLGDSLKKPDPWEFTPVDGCGCAIAGAYLAAGLRCDESAIPEHSPAFMAQWPWVTTEITSHISEMYFKLVENGSVTIEQIADYVRSVEPAEESTLPDLPLSEQLRLEEEAAAEEGAAIEASNLPYPEYERNGR